MSGFVVHFLLYQLSIHITTHCWCNLFHVVCNLTAAFSFTEGAVTPLVLTLLKCAAAPCSPLSQQQTLVFPDTELCGGASTRKGGRPPLPKHQTISLPLCRYCVFNAATRPFIFA